jgi:hypothetical protein
MTNLQLVEVDPTPGGNGLPALRTVVAISSSWKALEDYCLDTYGKNATAPPENYFGKNHTWEVHYVIEPSSVVIVRENINKFQK